MAEEEAWAQIASIAPVCLQALQEEFDTERSDMTSGHNRQKKEMADLMTAMEAEFAEADSEARQEFEAAREEIRNKSSEEYNVLKISLEGQIEELERTFEAAHQVCVHSHNILTEILLVCSPATF